MADARGPPDGRHMDDLQNEINLRITQLRQRRLGLSKLLDEADAAIKQAQFAADFHRRRNQAYVEFIFAYEIMVNEVPSHPEYPTMHANSASPIHSRWKHVLARVTANEDRYAKIREIILNENQRTGVTPQRSSHDSKVHPSSLLPGNSRPQSRDSTAAPQSHVGTSWFLDNSNGNSRSSTPSQHLSGTPNLQPGNARHESPKRKPLVKPKPESLHGSSMGTPGGANDPAEKLNQRFAQLRPSTSTSPATQAPPSTNITMPSPSDYIPKLSDSSVPTSLRPAGPRGMPPKLPLDTNMAAGMPKPPSPTYSPARNMQTPDGVPPPRSTARSAVGSTSRTNSSLGYSSVKTVANGTGGNQNPSINGSSIAASRRRGRVGLLNDGIMVKPQDLYDYMELYTVLLLDVRSRMDFDGGHIKSETIVCIEPVILRQNISGEDLQNALVLSPDEEQFCFGRRDQFELVVLYDEHTDDPHFLQSNGLHLTKSQEALRILYEAIYELSEKTLKNKPLILEGGVRRWAEFRGSGSLRVTDTLATANIKASQPQNQPISMPSPTIHISKSRRGAFNPLNREESQQWQERARAESVSISPGISDATFPHGTEEADVEQSENGTASYYRTQDDFFKKYPAMPLELESMVKPQTRNEPPSLSSSPPPRSSSIPPQPPHPARPSSASDSQPEMPSRPPPAAPRVSYSGAHDRLGGTTQYSTRANHLPPAYVPHAEKSRNVRLSRTGLINFGVTCYMNSTIQCLSATLPLTRFFKSKTYQSYLQRDSPRGSYGVLPQHYANLIEHLWAGDVQALRPTTFRGLCARLNDEWGTNVQQDAKEYFDFVIDYLHEDLNILWKNSIPRDLTPAEEAILEQLPPHQAAFSEWQRNQRRSRSIISDLFGGQHSSRLTCLSCGHHSTTYELFFTLSVEIPPPPPGARATDIRACLASYTHEERLREGDEWRCPKCQTQNNSSKKLTLTRAPRYLVVHFKRFRASHAASASKISTPVDFPLSGLELSRFFLPDWNGPLRTRDGRDLPMETCMRGPYVYDAYAVIRHLGASVSSGHYIALCKDPGRRRWRCFNDKDVRDFDPEVEPPQEDAYIAFFERVGEGLQEL